MPKKKTVKLYMRISPDTRKRLERLRKLENRSSLNNMIEHALKTYCDTEWLKLEKNRSE